MDNGSRRRLMDWANFLMTFGPFVPPITAAEHLRSPAIANLSLKRGTLPDAPLAPGELEFDLLPRFALEGRVAFDEAPIVWHVQSHGFLETIGKHFHNGRMTAGDGRITVATKALPRRGRASLPLLLLLCVAHFAGECAGAVLGPGQSAKRLE